MHLGHLFFSVHGRVSRKLWWLSQLLIWVCSVGTTAIYHKFGFHDAIFGVLLTILLFAMRLSVNIKRLHDQGMSGWWLLAFEIPVIGWIWGFIVLGCRKGHENDNDFGEPVHTVQLRGPSSIVAILVLCIFVGACGAATISTVESGLTAIELGAETYQKIKELHEVGASEDVLDKVRDAISKAHAIIDKHHKAHVK